MSESEAKPTLIDEEMLRDAILERLPQGQMGRIIRTEGIYFNETPSLHLEYRNILKIDHLWEFTSLTKLDLNNNLIERIEGLDPLINLKCLNLSFNKIERIEGLESLLKLELLNLCHNRISVIENMDTLEKLAHFLFADNLLEKIDSVYYLRKFKHLFSLTLRGNPVSEEDDYKLLMTAYFPTMKFLDYRYINMKTKKEASAKYHNHLEQMRQEELKKQKVAEAEKNQAAEVKSHIDAFVDSLNGKDLFRSVFEDDPVAQELHCVPGVNDLLQIFEEKMAGLCKQLFEIGLVEHKKRETEVNSFFRGQSKGVADAQHQAKQIMAEFDQQHTERMVELRKSTDQELIKVHINEHNSEINQLCKSLMTLEFQFASQQEGIIKMLEVNIPDMVGSFLETVDEIFAQCQDLENNFDKNVHEIAVATMEKVAKDSLVEDLPAHVRMLLTDREEVMVTLANSHDKRLLKINDRKTLLVTRITAWSADLMKEIRDKEVKCSRMRISDIHSYADHLRDQLEDFQ